MNKPAKIVVLAAVFVILALLAGWLSTTYLARINRTGPWQWKI
jgi:hypothetical protein